MFHDRMKCTQIRLVFLYSYQLCAKFGQVTQVIQVIRKISDAVGQPANRICSYLLLIPFSESLYLSTHFNFNSNGEPY